MQCFPRLAGHRRLSARLRVHSREDGPAGDLHLDAGRPHLSTAALRPECQRLLLRPHADDDERREVGFNVS